MPHSKETGSTYRAARYAAVVNDPAKHAAKKKAERDRYAEKKQDPAWLARKSKTGKASLVRRGARALESGRASKRKCLYGITRAEFDFMLREQGGHCAICPRTNGLQALSVDHCHATKKVRGLLCHGCNLSLGKMLDDPELFRRTAAYLERGRQVVMGAV